MDGLNEAVIKALAYVPAPDIAKCLTGRVASTKIFAYAELAQLVEHSTEN